MEKDNQSYRKLCIINHNTHQVFIECVPESLIAEKYDYEEENYIRDNYHFTDAEWRTGSITWDWFVELLPIGMASTNILQINEL